MSTLITFATLTDQRPRTLLYGALAAENASGVDVPQYLHVYTDSDQPLIAGVSYELDGAASHPIEAFDERMLENNEDYLGLFDGKRFIVTYCDAEFFVCLIRAGLSLEFGVASAPHVGRSFAGLRHVEFESDELARARARFRTRHSLRSH